jgi:purine-binding chemotaxis protein CheW
MDDLKLIARVAGQSIAIPASTIESVVEIDAITPVPLAPAHVAGLAALRSRVLTVIDTYAALGIEAAPLSQERQAVVVTIDGHLYGLLVDEVEDVVTVEGEAATIHAGVGAGWAAAALGLVDVEGRSMLLLDPARLVSGMPVRAVAA